MNQRIIVESEDPKIINDLYNSTEWCMPRWSETKGKYIIIRKATSLKK